MQFGSGSGTLHSAELFRPLTLRHRWFYRFKGAKCEIFDRSDFNDFYTIKSLCEGDFGVKIKKNYKNIQGFTQGARSICTLLRPLVSVHNDFLKFLIFEVLKKLLKKYTSLCVCSGFYAYAEHTRQELVRKLSICVRHRCAC